MPQQQLTIEFDGLPAVDLANLTAYAQAIGAEVSWANQYTLRRGKLPGSGTVVLTAKQFQKIQKPTQYRHILAFGDGTRKLIISKLAVVAVEAIDLGKNVPGVTANSETLYLGHLADARHSASGIIDRSINARTAFNPSPEMMTAEAVVRELWKPLQPLLRVLQFHTGTQSTRNRQIDIWNIRAQGEDAWDTFIHTVHELGWDFLMAADGQPWVVPMNAEPTPADVSLLKLGEQSFEAPGTSPELSRPLPEQITVVSPKLDYQWWKSSGPQTGEDKFYTEPIYTSTHPIQGRIPSSEHGRIIPSATYIVYSSIPLIFNDSGQPVNKEAVDQQHLNCVERFAKALAAQREVNRSFYGVWPFDFANGYFSEMTVCDSTPLRGGTALTTEVTKTSGLENFRWNSSHIDTMLTNVPYARSAIVEVVSETRKDQAATVFFKYGQIGLTGVTWTSATQDSAINATGETLKPKTRCKADWFYQLGTGGAWVLTGILSKDEDNTITDDICERLTKKSDYPSFDLSKWQLFGHKAESFCMWFTLCDVVKSLPGYVPPGSKSGSTGRDLISSSSSAPRRDQYFVIDSNDNCKLKELDICTEIKTISGIKPKSTKRQYLSLKPFVSDYSDENTFQCEWFALDVCAELKQFYNYLKTVGQLVRHKKDVDRCEWGTICSVLIDDITGFSSAQAQVIKHAANSSACEWGTYEGGGGDACSQFFALGSYVEANNQMLVHLASGSCSWTSFCSFLKTSVGWAAGGTPPAGLATQEKYLVVQNDGTCQTIYFDVCQKLQALPDWSAGIRKLINSNGSTCRWDTLCDLLKVSTGWAAGGTPPSGPSTQEKYVVIQNDGSCSAIYFDICTKLQNIDPSYSSGQNQMLVHYAGGSCAWSTICTFLKTSINWAAGGTAPAAGPNTQEKYFVIQNDGTCQATFFDLCAKIKFLPNYSTGSSRRQFVSVTSGNCQVEPLDLCAEIKLLPNYSTGSTRRQFVSVTSGTCQVEPLDLCTEIKLLPNYSTGSTRRQFVSVTSGTCQVEPLDLCAEIKLLPNYSAGSSRRQFVSVTSGTCQVEPLDICVELKLLTAYNQTPKQFIGHDAGSSVCKWIDATTATVDCAALSAIFSPPSTGTWAMCFVNGACQLVEVVTC